MYIKIGIEDLVANALIELAEKSKKRKVFFRELDEYGACVIKYLTDQGERAVLILSTESTNKFLHDYSDFFELFLEDGEEGIRLKDNVSVEQLWDKFRGYLSVDVMKAFMSQTATRVLGVYA